MSEESEIEELAGLWRPLVEKTGDRFDLTINSEVLLALIASVQLSLRHPGNVGPAADVMRRFLEELIRKLDEAAPGVGLILRKGFDPGSDVPRDREEAPHG